MDYLSNHASVEAFREKEDELSVPHVAAIAGQEKGFVAYMDGDSPCVREHGVFGKADTGEYDEEELAELAEAINGDDEGSQTADTVPSLVRELDGQGICILTTKVVDAKTNTLQASVSPLLGGPVVWSCDKPFARIEGSRLTFTEHYIGTLTLTACVGGVSVSREVEAVCNEEVLFVTNELVEVYDVEPVRFNITEATVKYRVIPTLHYKFHSEVAAETDKTRVVTFGKNTTDDVITRSGSFTDGGAEVQWELEQNCMPDANDCEYVDLDLPSGTLWAMYNVGAGAEDEEGNYYAWGETGTKSSYDWSNYAHGSNWDNISKYNTGENGLGGTVDNLTELELEDDAAHDYMGGDWRMPSKEQIEELLKYTISEWTDEPGIYGRRFTSKKDSSKSIFIPAAGNRYGSSVGDQGSLCYLWSRSLFASNPYRAWNLLFNSGNQYLSYVSRYFGFSVRGVL